MEKNWLANEPGKFKYKAFKTMYKVINLTINEVKREWCCESSWGVCVLR